MQDRNRVGLDNRVGACFASRNLGGENSRKEVPNVVVVSTAEYLGDAPLAMAILDRLVDGAIVLKISGRSYRAHRSTTLAANEEKRKSTGDVDS